MNQDEKRYAPWWIYVILIVAANLGKQLLLPDDLSAVANAAVTAATIGGVYWLITVVYRSMTAPERKG